MTRLITIALLVGLWACSNNQLPGQSVQEQAPIQVKIAAFNDFHGNLEPPKIAVPTRLDSGEWISSPAGGAAYMANTINALRKQSPHFALVSAGDMIGASPLISALFLDEPTIEVANAMQLDFNAVGNHEFDKGVDELKRMQSGGCKQHTQRIPCLLNKSFTGANFQFLAANVLEKNGESMFPSVGWKEFKTGNKNIKVAFIGMTLKGTPSIVTPSGVAGLRFEDEAQITNAWVPQLRAQGANAIIVLIHEGGVTQGVQTGQSCENLTGDILPILDKLDPNIDVVISGHTHRAYVCNYSAQQASKPLLLTSAGQYGTFVTDIDLVFDARTGKLIKKTAQNVIVQSEAFQNAAGQWVTASARIPQFEKEPAVEQIVAHYRKAAAVQSSKKMGQLSQSVLRVRPDSSESLVFPLGYLIADAQLQASQAKEKGGAQIAFMNPGGVRADLLVSPSDTGVSFAQLFSVQPFSNQLVTKNFTGQQIKALLEQQYRPGDRNLFLLPSSSFSYEIDETKAVGQRVQGMKLNGTIMNMNDSYRVTMNSFLATGGDKFTVFNQGQNSVMGELDVDALAQYLSTTTVLPEHINAPRILRVNKK